AIILVGMLITENKNKVTKEDSCNKLCLQGGTEGWFLLSVGPTDDNSFSTKDECVSSCLSRK
ncbi:MAG: hypothetical protein Q7S77_00790, partial [Candidatus Staskawiczbacteria bacterium]|nr:hypothetical protein [Candidatus Staskawiczbacteria bacterium]